MKIHAIAVIIVTVVAIRPIVGAQTCYTPITSWQGSYTLSGNGTGVACGDGSPGGGTLGTCDIKQSASATVNMNNVVYAELR